MGQVSDCLVLSPKTLCIFSTFYIVPTLNRDRHLSKNGL